MKKLIILLLILAVFVPRVSAEEFVIEKPFYCDINDASGSDADNPKDANGVETAIVKVQCTMNDLLFVSDYIIGNQRYNQGQYVFFMAEGARTLEVRKKDGTILPVTIKFADAGIKRLKRKNCYKMIISGKDVKYYGQLIVNYGPQGAILRVNDKIFTGGNTYDQLLEIGRYTIRVDKSGGYSSYNEVIDVTRDTTIERTIHLSQSQAELSIVTDELSDIYVDGMRVGQHKYDAMVSIGMHKVKVQHGSHYEEQEINVTGAGATYQKEILGCLRESFEKSNQDFKSGYDHLTPCKKNDMESRTIFSETTNSLLGDYKVTFTRPGYWSRSKNVHVEAAQTATVEAPNLYPARSWTFFSYQYSPKSNIGLMLGVCGKFGGYVSGRFNVGPTILEQNLSPHAENNSFGINSWSIDGGLMFRICQELYLYAGAGYGNYESAGTTFREAPYMRGFNAEAGVIENIHGKSGKGFTITAGYNTLLSREYFDVMDPLTNIVAGIGFAL